MPMDYLIDADDVVCKSKTPVPTENAFRWFEPIEIC
jgi:hypothetical protein